MARNKHKYLDDAGFSYPESWTSKAKEGKVRQKAWDAERAKYGFDERDTWEMTQTFYCWLYERLKYFKEFVGKNIDLNYHKLEYNGEERTQAELVDMILERIEAFFRTPAVSPQESEYIHEIEKIWVILMPLMWW